MSRQMKDELYYEEYDNVAVMFATITNYALQTDATVDIEKNILSILNRIICEFDEKLLSKTGPLKIEKIKVSGWTYMVACGLDPGRGDSSVSLNGQRFMTSQRTSLTTNGRRSWNMFRKLYKIHCASMPPTNWLFRFVGSAPQSPRNLPAYDPLRRARKPSSRQSQNVVYVLTEFALELMRILQTFNEENFQNDGQLRIGRWIIVLRIRYVCVWERTLQNF